MAIAVASEVIERIRAEAARAAPREACGILLGRVGHIERAAPAANVHPQPERFFEIDPAALVAAHRAARLGGPEVVGYYHSHPNGRARPSRHDRALAARDGAIWAIEARGELKFFRARAQGFEPLAVRIV